MIGGGGVGGCEGWELLGNLFKHPCAASRTFPAVRIYAQTTLLKSCLKHNPTSLVAGVM